MIRSALASSRWSPAKVRTLQEKRLRKLIHYAYRNVPLYRRLYDEHGFRPEEFRSLDDLAKIPRLEKDRLRAADPLDLTSKEADPHSLSSVVTSGSTGHPLRIYLSPSELRWQRVVAWRILFEHGFRWTDRTMEIRMTPGDKFLIQSLGIAPKSWLSILDDPETWAQALRLKRHKVLVAGASTLRALAETTRALAIDYHRPQIVISDSETLSPQTRKLIHTMIGTDPVDVYGLVELSNFAWQCELRCGYHVSADSHIVELPAAPGTTGKIVVTALGMWVMPFIRYDTGDIGELQTKPCSCGRNTPILRRIYGRAVDSVLLPNGQQLFWPFFHETLGAYDNILQWRVIQNELLNLTVEFTSSKETSSLRKRMESDLRSVLPCNMGLTIKHVKNIQIRPGEKARMVVSNLRSTVR